MANDLTSNPWVIDTASASVLCQTNVAVEHFEFAGYSAQGSQCIVQDRSGKTVWAATGAADLEEVRSGKVGWIQGLKIPTLENGGVLRVYIR
jgi:hypothetical protein